MLSRSASALILFTAVTGIADNALAETRVHAHDIAVRIDPTTRSLTATDSIRIEGAGRVIFRLATGLTPDGIRIDGIDIAPHHAAGIVGGVVDGAWMIELGTAGMHHVAIHYGGSPGPMPGGHSGHSDHSDHSDRGGDGIFGPAEPVIEAIGTYLPPASGWYPLFDGIAFSYRIAVDVPETQRAVVPGRLIAEKTVDGRYHGTFESEVPSDGIALMAGPYTVTEKQYGKIQLRTYFHAPIAAMAPEYLESLADYIGYYSDLIGKYPYSSFNIVSGPFPVGLGFAGLTYMGTRVLALPFIRHRSLPHEVLHTWWGNGVLVGYAQGNWAEGLTTFMADYALAERRDAAKARGMRLGWLRDYAALPANRDHPAADFIAKRHDAAQVIGYNKVAFLFYMLRRDIGAPAFETALREFWQAHKLRDAGWPDLRKSFEDAAGHDLGWFFDQWLDRRGAPSLRLDTLHARRQGKGYRVSLRIAQDQPPYALSIPVRITTDHGNEMFTATLRNTAETFSFFTKGKPSGIAVDPDFAVFRRLDPRETPPIIRDVTLRSDVSTLILADTPPATAMARRLAERLLDTPPRFINPDPRPSPAAPLLIIGLTDQVRLFLKRSGLPAVPERLATRGTARVWAARHNGVPLLVVAANDGEALAALLRPLPHYGRKSYLLFSKDKAQESGVWPAPPGPLHAAVHLGK